MQINKIKINNFYSIKEATINFDSYNGIVLIEGINKDTKGSNGSGKSAIIEAVVYGLFGKTIRKSTEEALINNQVSKECSIELLVNDSVVIKRGRRPSFLKIIIDGKDETKDTAQATQEYIDFVLKTNYKVFLASTIFGQQNNIEFISSTPDDKRLIIKNFLNVEEIFDLRESVKYLKSEYTSKIKGFDSVISEYEKNIKDLDQKIKIIEESNDFYSVNSVLSSFNMEELKSYDFLEVERKNLKLDSSIASLNDSLTKINYRIRNNKAICAECGQPIKVSYSIEDLKRDKEKIIKEIKELESLKIIPIMEYKEYKKLNNYLLEKNNLNSYKELKSTYLNNIQEKLKSKQEYLLKYEVMRFWEKAFSESGLVKYIIRNILKYFNTRVNYYLSIISQGKFSIEFDEELNEKITHKKKIIHHMSLSGGEKKKINFSAMLALQDLLSLGNKDKSNIVFFDEVAESLDREGIDGLYTLLQELKKTKTLFIITHNNYLKSLIDSSKTITVTKYNGISKIKGD